MRTPLLRGWIALWLMLLAPQVWAFEIAFTPFLPVRTMLKNYEPMRVYLESHLHEPVTLITAPDYQSYNEHMRDHVYPFVITVANSAYLAYADYGYVPMLRPTIPTRPVLVISKSSRLNSIKALRGTTIALPDRLAIISMQGAQMLHEAGLNPEQDVKIQYMQNHSAAVNLVINGEASAAIVSDRALLQMPKATRTAVRALQTWDAGAAPGVVYLASPNVPRERVEKMHQAILEFVRDTQEGRVLMKQLGYGGLVPVTSEELKLLAPYGALLKATQESKP